MANLTKQILVEPEQVEKAVENVSLERQVVEEAAIAETARKRVETDLGPLPEPIKLNNGSKGLTLKDILEGRLKNADPELKEKLTKELIAQHYGINKITKTPITNLEQTISDYDKHVETYIKTINKYFECATTLLFLDSRDLKMLTEESLIDEKDALIYEAAIEKIHNALNRLDLRSLKHIKEYKSGTSAIVYGSVCTLIGLSSAAAALAMANPLPFVAGILSIVACIKTETTLEKIKHEKKFSLDAKGIAAYKKEVTKHIQKYGQTLGQDLEIAVEYAQKLQKQLGNMTPNTTIYLNSSDTVESQTQTYLPRAIEALTKLKETYKR